jgi:hypothetical protein
MVNSPSFRIVVVEMWFPESVQMTVQTFAHELWKRKSERVFSLSIPTDSDQQFVFCGPKNNHFDTWGRSANKSLFLSEAAISKIEAAISNNSIQSGRQVDRFVGILKVCLKFKGWLLR